MRLDNSDFERTNLKVIW